MLRRPPLRAEFVGDTSYPVLVALVLVSRLASPHNAVSPENETPGKAVCASTLGAFANPLFFASKSCICFLKLFSVFGMNAANCEELFFVTPASFGDTLFAALAPCAFIALVCRRKSSLHFVYLTHVRGVAVAHAAGARTHAVALCIGMGGKEKVRKKRLWSLTTFCKSAKKSAAHSDVSRPHRRA